MGFVHIRIAHNKTDKSFQKQNVDEKRDVTEQTKRAVTAHPGQWVKL
jgi:hypothetical protein